MFIFGMKRVKKIKHMLKILALCLGVFAAMGIPVVNGGKRHMDTENMKILQTSNDPDKVCQAALEISGGENPEELKLLGELLGSGPFLSRLDSAEDYESPPETLNITGILETLGGNFSPEAKNVLVELTRNRVFLSHLSRVEMLILACAEIRPVPEPVMKFWTSQVDPGSSSCPLVVESLFTNATEQAMKLFETMMADPSYPLSDKDFWLLTYAVPHRDDLHFLEIAERVITADADRNMTLEWIRIIFDYKETWYPPIDMPKPPDPNKIEPMAKDKLMEVAEIALAVKDLPLDLRKAVETRTMLYGKQKEK